MADDPGTQPPERRRRQRRVVASDAAPAAPAGERRVRPDRRRAAATTQPVPAPDVEAPPEPSVEAPIPSTAADPDATSIWSPTAATLASMRTSMPGLSAPPPVERIDVAHPASGIDATVATDAMREGSWLPVLEDRSPDPATCPFLRSVGTDGGRQRMIAPVESPDPVNRCAALTEAVPQSLRQQELVCLTSGHVNCPRYLRGAVAQPEPVVSRPRVRTSLSPATLAAVAVLVMAFAASIAFVTARGGLAIDAAATTRPSASAVAQVSAPPSVEPSVVVTAEPTAVPTPTPAATPEPTPEPTATPTAAPTPRPDPTPAPTRTPRPTSDRYRLLTPCPGTPDCWIYTVRSGDNLYSIANYFGVSLDAIYARNPWARDTPLRAGMELRLPPPTR